VGFFDGEKFTSGRGHQQVVFYTTGAGHYLCAACATRVCQSEVIALAVVVGKRTERALTCDLCEPDKAAKLPQVYLNGVRLHENTVVFGKEEILLYNRFWKKFHDLGYPARRRDTEMAQYCISEINAEKIVLFRHGDTTSIEHTGLASLYTMDDSYAEEPPPVFSGDPELALRQRHAYANLWWRPGEELLKYSLPWRNIQALWYESVSQKEFPGDASLPKEPKVLCDDCATRSLMDRNILLWPVRYTWAGGKWKCGTCGTIVDIPIVLKGGKGYGEGFHSRD